MNTALEGLQRNQAGIQVCATNIAHMNMPEGHAQRLDTADKPMTPDNRTPDLDPDPNVDLATEVVQMKTYTVGVRANAKVISVLDRLLGELMDTLA
jgi:flagellar hook-associated protein FlgK